ncbi:MAG: hypothetical protein HFH51_08900 [Lachnospiraceae bacterium]|nr:hypothetical protein [Lachnospiraceae bacterium]
MLGERKRSGKASAEGEIEPLRWLFLMLGLYSRAYLFAKWLVIPFEREEIYW